MIIKSPYSILADLRPKVSQSCAKTENGDNKRMLEALGRTIAERDTYERIKQERIDSIKAGIRPDTTDSLKYEIYDRLFDEYYVPLQSSNLYNQRIWSLDIIAGNSEVGAGASGGDDGIETVQCANFAADAFNGFALYILGYPWVGINGAHRNTERVSSGIHTQNLFNRSVFHDN